MADIFANINTSPQSSAGYAPSSPNSNIFSNIEIPGQPQQQSSPQPSASGFPQASLVTPESIGMGQQPQQGNDIFSNIESGIGNAVSGVKDFFSHAASDLNNLRLTIAESNPVFKSIGDFLNSQGTESWKGQKDFAGYTYTGDTPKDLANIILDNLPALLPIGGDAEVASDFSKSRAAISAAVQAGVQMLAGQSPKEIIANLPFGLLGGMKMKEAPEIFTPDQVKNEVTTTDLKNTPLGNEMMKTAFQAEENNNHIQLSYDPASPLKTQLDFPVKVEMVDPNSAGITQGITQQEPGQLVTTRNINDLITHEEAPDLQTIAQYKQAIESGDRPALVVMPEGEKWGVEDGKHKLEAYKQAGITEVPTIDKSVVTGQINQLFDLRSITSPQDEVLNPIIDEYGKMIKSNVKEITTQAKDYLSENGTNKNTEITSTESNKALGLPNEAINQNSGQFQRPEVTSKSSETAIPSEGQRFNSGGEPTNSINAESTNASPNALRDGEGLKVSKIAKEIDAKAVERGLTQGYSELAGYSPITIKEQAAKASDLINNHIDDARAVIRGEKPLPEGLKGTSLVTAMEEHLSKNPDGETLMELAKSPLVSGTSEAAQELRLAAERDSYSPISIIKKLENDRRAVIEAKKGEDVGSTIKRESKNLDTAVKKEIAKNSGSKGKLSNFIKGIQC